MLQQEDLKKVNAVLDDAEGQRGMLIAVLQRVQEKVGYLPEDAMKMIAERMSLSLNNVYGVASFYKHFHFKPRGKNIVKVCMGTACHVRGAKAVLTEMENKLGIKEGETTEGPFGHARDRGLRRLLRPGAGGHGERPGPLRRTDAEDGGRYHCDGEE